jgi:tetratricopeptide (TPR) repeat protein
MGMIYFISGVYLSLALPFALFASGEQQILGVLVSWWIVAGVITVVMWTKPDNNPSRNTQTSINDLFFRNLTASALQLVAGVYGLWLLNHIIRLSEQPAITIGVYLLIALVSVPYSFKVTFLQVKLPKHRWITWLIYAIPYLIMLFALKQYYSWTTITITEFSLVQLALIALITLTFHTTRQQLNRVYTPPRPTPFFDRVANVYASILVISALTGLTAGALLLRSMNAHPIIKIMIVFIVSVGLIVGIAYVLLQIAGKHFMKQENENSLLKAVRYEDYPAFPTLIETYTASYYDYHTGHMIGYMYFLLNDLPRATEFLKQSIQQLLEIKKLLPLQESLLTHNIALLSQIYLEQGQPEYAKESLDRAFKYVNSSPYVYVILARWHLEQGQIEEAKSILKLMDEKAFYFEISFDRNGLWALIHEIEGDSAQADAVLAEMESLMQYPSDHRSNDYYHGKVYQERGMIEQARTAYEKLLTAPVGTHPYLLGVKALAELQPDA